MVGVDDIVITGLGCVTPIGIGRSAFRDSLLSGTCAVARLHRLDDDAQTAFYGAEIPDFNGKTYVTPRKALKVMSREVQTAYSAAHLAWQDAGLAVAAATGGVSLDPDRMGVVFGSEMIPGDHEELAGAVASCRRDGVFDQDVWAEEFGRQIFPLWMLKNLPNMPACHVGIAIDARGPNNTIAQEEVSSLLALAEAASVIDRGVADLMVVGGVGSRVAPTRLLYRAQRLYNQHPSDDTADETAQCLPFDSRRRGIVPSEGAGAIVIERRSHAVARGANILASLRGWSSRCANPARHLGGSQVAVSSAIKAALCHAELEPQELDHVSAQGFSEEHLDVSESRGIAESLGDVPVTAFSSYFGTAGAACGLLELMASLVGMLDNKRLPSLGIAHLAPECPVRVCREMVDAEHSHFLKTSLTPFGHAAAVVVECER